MNKNSTLYVVLFMIALTALFGLAVSFVHYATIDVLAKNASLHFNRTVSQAFFLPVRGKGADAYRAAVETHVRQDTITVRGKPMVRYATVKGERPLLGFAFTAMGFWDRITGILVLSPDLLHIENIRFLEQHETPGLGARIEEPGFIAQFRHRAIAWEQAPAGRVEFDAVTGASQTSMGLQKSLNEIIRDVERYYKKDG